MVTVSVCGPFARKEPVPSLFYCFYFEANTPSDVSNVGHSDGGMRTRREMEEGPVTLVTSTGPRHSAGHFRSQRRHGRPGKVLKPL